MEVFKTINLFIAKPIYLKLTLERKFIEFKTYFRFINKQESLKQYEELKIKWKQN